MRASLRLGGGAGFAGDRLDAPVDLALRGKLDYLILECLAERTIALAQLRRRRDPATGYDTRLRERVESLLPVLARHRVKLVSNFGAANPLAAADAIVDIARRLQIPVKVAAVTGDDVLDALDPSMPTMETGAPLSSVGAIVSANAYLGAEALLPALATGANIVVTGRVADPSLIVAPLMHEYGWSADDWDRLARGTVVGHLLECAGQLCGGYFADPGRKDIPHMASLGFPFADVDAQGNATLGKVDGTGGRITRATATEQLLYEVTDPHGYLTPDVVADFSAVTLTQTAQDRIEVRGARGRARPPQLKVSVGYLAATWAKARSATRAPMPSPARSSPRRSCASAWTDGSPSCASTSSAARRCTAAPSTPMSIPTKSGCASPRARSRARTPPSSATKWRRSTRTARPAVAARASTSPSRSASCRRSSIARG